MMLDLLDKVVDPNDPELQALLAGDPIDRPPEWHALMDAAAAKLARQPISAERKAGLAAMAARSFLESESTKS